MQRSHVRERENVEKPVHSYSLCCRCRSSKKNSTIAELYNNLYASQMVAADRRAKMSPQRTISLVSTITTLGVILSK